MERSGASRQRIPKRHLGTTGTKLGEAQTWTKLYPKKTFSPKKNPKPSAKAL